MDIKIFKKGSIIFIMKKPQPHYTKATLFNHKSLRFKITVISSGDCNEFQNTIVRVHNPFFIIHSISFFPYHFFTDMICQDFDVTFQHHPSKKAGIAKIDTRMIVLQKLCYPHRRSVCSKVKGMNSFDYNI